MNTEQRISAFVALMTTVNLSYNEEAKAIFHRQGKQVARSLATMLGLQKGTYDVRSNTGGIAVSGEVTLHGEKIYVQFSQGTMGNGTAFMYRACLGRRDYTGRQNHWMQYEDLVNRLPWVVRNIRQTMEKESNLQTPEIGRLA